MKQRTRFQNLVQLADSRCEALELHEVIELFVMWLSIDFIYTHGRFCLERLLLQLLPHTAYSCLARLSAATAVALARLLLQLLPHLGFYCSRCLEGCCCNSCFLAVLCYIGLTCI